MTFLTSDYIDLETLGLLAEAKFAFNDDPDVNEYPLLNKYSTSARPI